MNQLSTPDAVAAVLDGFILGLGVHLLVFPFFYFVDLISKPLRAKRATD